MASSKRGGDKPRKNGGTNGNGVGHNSEARMKAMDEAIEEFCGLQSQEEALLEKYIAPIREKKNKVKARLKSDYEVPTAAFNARAALRLIEKADNDEVVFAVNELFKATPVGKNLDLIALTERVEKARADKAAAKAKAQSQPEASL